MTGSVQKKNGYYYIVLNFRNKDGKRVPRWMPTKLKVKNNTKTQANRILQQYISEYDGMEKLSNYGELPTEKFVRDYLEKRHDMRAIADVTYENHISDLKHIEQFFKINPTKLKDLKSSQVKDMYEFLLSRGKFVKHGGGEEGLSRKTVQHVQTLLNNAMKDAVMYGVFKKNPCEGIPVPKTKIKLRDEEFLDTEDAAYFLDTIKGDRLEHLYVFAIFYGMRRGELIGLRWSSINLKKRTFIINHTITAGRNIIVQDATKTAESHREYPILDFTYEILMKIKATQENYKKLLGDDYKDSGYVFTWEDGRPYRPNYFTRSFKKIVREDDRLSSDLRLHDLRSTCVCLLMEDSNVTMKDIQKWVGHEDEITTLKYYAKVKNKKKEVVAAGMENTFNIISGKRAQSLEKAEC